MAYSSNNIKEMQREIAPEIYNHIDLDITPERFRTTIESKPNGAQRSINVSKLKKFLEDPEEVELYRQLTLMGDPIADAFAAKIPKLGFRKTRALLDKALEEGIDAVEDAPPELIRLIKDMEKIPEWLDLDKIEHFHDKTRLFNAVTQNYIMRLAFMMTYMNGYQGLPMIMTGQLSGDSAANRMRETTSTFKMATLPGALRRDGLAFKSAAKVRVMHAMVRMNLLKNKDKWDYEVYGTPIPQVDQMGAALGYNFAVSLISSMGKRPLSRLQKEGIDASRYLAYLLGMHDYFLSDKRRDIIKTWSMLGATLRDKFDPRATELNKATLYAYTRSGYSPLDKFMHMLDVKNTRFLYKMVVGKKKAKQMGVETKATDVFATATLAYLLGSQFVGLTAISKLPGGKKWVNDWAVNETKRQLKLLGEAKYHTDEQQYAVNKKSKQTRDSTAAA